MRDAKISRRVRRSNAIAAAVVVAGAALHGCACCGASHAVNADASANAGARAGADARARAGVATSAAPAADPAAPSWSASPADAEQALAGWNAQHAQISERVRSILLARLGTPYVLGSLGEGRGASPDSDPVFRLDEVDCTVLVLTTAALAHARTLAEAERNMALANYREVLGERQVTYGTRLHFTEDRLDASPYFRNITASVVPESLLAARQITLNEKQSGEKLLPIEWTRPITLRYLPASRATAALLATLPPVTGVAFIKESYFKNGLAAAHEGVILDGADLVHASSEAKKVVRVPFLDYLRRSDGSFRFDGLVFYEFR
ncbi:MAG: N-acetylmuramoyl-L-alanine amidase-like domain-containing protein [bacterium]